MPYTKLTSKQEKFCQEIVKGNSQRQSYYIAYPSSRNWKEENVDLQANRLMKNPKVIRRLEELRAPSIKKTLWTRQKVLDEIEEVLNLHKQDMIRIDTTIDEEIEQKMNELQEWTSLLNVPNVDTKGVNKHIQQITQELQNIKLKRKANAVNTNRNL